MHGAGRWDPSPTLIAELVPPGVRTAELFDDPPGDVLFPELFPEEAAVVAGAVDKRRREFAAVRRCARRALAELGVAPAPILPGDRGAPRWPPGVVGSLTHCAGYRGAAVARAGDLDAVGIDAEPNEPLPEGVLPLVAGPGEAARLEGLARSRPGLHADRLLFSAKEAVYKAWFPLTGRWLDFDGADVRLDAGGTFEAHLTVAAPLVRGRPLHVLPGRWHAAGGLVLTAVVLPAARPADP